MITLPQPTEVRRPVPVVIWQLEEHLVRRERDTIAVNNRSSVRLLTLNLAEAAELGPAITAAAAWTDEPPVVDATIIDDRPRLKWEAVRSIIIGNRPEWMNHGAATEYAWEILRGLHEAGVVLTLANGREWAP